MAKLIIATFAMLVSLLAFAESDQAKLDEVRAEKKKVQEYINQGHSGTEMKQELEKLSKREAELEKKVLKPKRKEVSKKKRTTVKKKKKAAYKRPSYSVDKNLSLRDQYSQVLADLEKEQEVLASLESSIERGVASSYLNKPIKEIKGKISAIQYEKTKIERRLASEGASTIKPELKIGAMLDFYYLYSPGRSQEGTNLSSRNYDRKNNDFTLNLFEINAEASLGDISFYADLDFGDFADQNQSHSGDGINHNIGQAYLTYTFSDQLSLSAGKMYTHVGYEVAKAMENWNYSRSFAFSLAGPFWHEGIALKYSHQSGFSSGLFIYDNWDSSTENNSEKTYGAQLGYVNDKFHFLFNLINGPEGSAVSRDRTVYEFNTQYALTDSVSVALNGVVGKDEKALTPATGSTNVDKEWNAWVLYVNWQATSKWSFTPRFEIFSDKTSGAASNQFIFSDMGATKANDVQSYTLTATYQTNDYSQFRFEFRNDKADEKIWTDGDGKAEDSLNTLSLSWLVKI